MDICVECLYIASRKKQVDMSVYCSARACGGYLGISDSSVASWCTTCNFRNNPHATGTKPEPSRHDGIPPKTADSRALRAAEGEFPRRSPPTKQHSADAQAPLDSVSHDP